VAAQALRRVGAAPAPAAAATGTLTVILSGRPDALPEAAFAYPEGRALAGQPVRDGLPGRAGAVRARQT
jgi:glutamate racemase